MTAIGPYSRRRIARGISSLLAGKTITSIAGIGTFLLLVRSLPVEQFAAYTVLFAMVELVETITGVGLSQVMSRYVPELYARHQRYALKRLIAYTVGLRLAVLAVALGAIYLFAPAVSNLIGLLDWQWALKAYLAVVLVRVAALTLFTVLESMLHQAIAQLGFGLITALRFVLLAIVASRGGLDLQTVILIELATDAVGVTVMLGGLLRTMAREAGNADESRGWARTNLRRLLVFGAQGYLQSMLILPFGGGTNRLLVGSSLPAGEVALFGFAHAIADLMQRYLPVKLLAGVIRPVLTARYVRDGSFADLELAANLIFKFNAVVICLAAVVIFAGREPMLSLISAGKYGEGSVSLLLMMCLLVLMYSLRHMLDHVCQAVERNGPLIWSNTLITLSVLPGIALLPVMGVYALPLSNVVGLVAGSLLLVQRLHAAGFDYHQELTGLGKMLVATGIAVASTEALHRLGGHWLLVVLVGATVFLGAVWRLRPLNVAEQELVGEMAGRKRAGAAQ